VRTVAHPSRSTFTQPGGLRLFARCAFSAGGFYDSPWGKHPRVQILTVDELLAGKGIDYPNVRGANLTFKRAPKADRPDAEALGLKLD